MSEGGPESPGTVAKREAANDNYSREELRVQEEFKKQIEDVIKDYVIAPKELVRTMMLDVLVNKNIPLEDNTLTSHLYTSLRDLKEFIEKGQLDTQGCKSCKERIVGILNEYAMRNPGSVTNVVDTEESP